MSIFDKDLIEKEYHPYYIQLLKIHPYEYWEELPEELLEQLFIIHTGKQTKDFNNNEGNTAEANKYLIDVLKIFNDNISRMFRLTGEARLSFKTFIDTKKLDDHGKVIHQCNAHPDQPMWMQSFIGFSYRI